MNENQGDSQPRANFWSLELLQLPNGQFPYQSFRSSLDPFEIELLDLCVERILAKAGLDICQTNWGKALGDGLYEFRINRSLESITNNLKIPLTPNLRGKQTKLMRVFFTVERNRIILLISGYDKGRNPNKKKQQKMISAARAMLRQHRKNS